MAVGRLRHRQLSTGWNSWRGKAAELQALVQQARRVAEAKARKDAEEKRALQAQKGQQPPEPEMPELVQAYGSNDDERYTALKKSF